MSDSLLIEAIKKSQNALAYAKAAIIQCKSTLSGDEAIDEINRAMESNAEVLNSQKKETPDAVAE